MTDVEPLEKLISFETAAEHATSKVPIVSPVHKVADVRAGLMGGNFDTANLIVVEEGGLFRGVVRLEALLADAAARQQVPIALGVKG